MLIQIQNMAACIGLAVLLHYFLLASFCWMLVEGVLHYLYLVKVFDAYIHHFVLKACIFSWGEYNDDK